MDQKQVDIARRAVNAFRAMLPGLNGYVRAITGLESAEIQIAAGPPRTDGRVIYLQPPTALGKELTHERRMCDKRNETGLLVCPACEAREQVLASIYHELAHIVFESQGNLDPYEVRTRLVGALDHLGPEWIEGRAEKVQDLDNFVARSPLNAAGVVSPHLASIVNVIEDIRVDTSMFKVRRGVRTMHMAKTFRYLTEGVEGMDGKIYKWINAPLDAQAIAAVLLMGMGYSDVRQYLSPEVHSALDSPRIKELAESAENCRSSVETLVLSVEVFAELLALGFCQTRDDPQEENQSDEEESESPEPEDSPDTPGGGEPSGGGGEDSSDASDGDAGPAGEMGTSSGESSDDVDDAPSNEPGDESDDSSERGAAAGKSDGSGDADNQEGDGDSGDARDPDSGEPEQAASSGEPAYDQGEDPDGSEPGSEAVSEGTASSGLAGKEDVEVDREGSDATEAEGESFSEANEAPQAEGSSDFEDGEVSEDGSGSREDSEEEGVDSTGLEGSESTSVAGDTPVAGDLLPMAGEDFSDPDEVAQIVALITGHSEDEDEVFGDSEIDTKVIAAVILQGDYYETPSTKVSGIRLHEYNKPCIQNGVQYRSLGWSAYSDPRVANYARIRMQQYGLRSDEGLEVPEAVLGKALLEMRRTFQDNKASSMERHLKSGRVNTSALGKRAWSGDPRLFQKKRVPAKKSYAVLIGIDISGSTVGPNLYLAKRAAMAQAELCHRTGVEFAVYAHTASPEPGQSYSTALGVDLYEVKKFNEAWSTETQTRLESLASAEENLDGHTIEIYRKMIEDHPATDKIVLYYTDGKMPAANADEELVILRKEILNYKRRGIALMGVGIRTDSPVKHGLDTVRVDEDGDLGKVVRHLEGALLRHR